MNRRISELQVGVLTLAAIILLVVGMLWLKGMRVNENLVLYQADFARVEGMKVGDNVQVRGIRMGEVSSMEIIDTAVRVGLQLNDTVVMHEDATITLGEKGIVGEIVIEINPGTGKSVTEGHIFKGRTAGTIASMTDAAGAALDELLVVTDKVSELLDEIKTTGKVVETLAQANVTIEKLDTMVEDNQDDVAIILGDLKVASDGLRSLMESGQIEATFSDASSVMTRADSMMITMDGVALRLDHILAKLDEGGGSAAMLLNDPDLYMHADSTMVSVKRLVDAMRRNPKRFFDVNVLDF
jgi:phospholipid/cholesterol/gamma-HCH transport system substrate-binding protein